MEEVVQGSKDTKLRAVAQAKSPEDEFNMVSGGGRETPLQGTYIVPPFPKLFIDEGSHSGRGKVDSKHHELTVLVTVLFAVTRYLPRSDMGGEGFVLVHSSEEDSLSGRGR